MLKTQFLQQIYPYVGGEANISRTIWKDSAIILTVKDNGVVDLAFLQQMPNVVKGELNRGRVSIQTQNIEELEETTMAKDYTQLSKDLIAAVGGKENVKSLMHCVTRLRFIVKDRSLVQEDEIKKYDGVMGCQWAGEQFQVIIGPHVKEVYDLVCGKLGIAQTAEVKDDIHPEDNKSLKDRLIGLLGSIFMPSMPLIIAGGMIKAFCMMFLNLGLVDPTTGMFSLMMAVGDAPFYFIAISLGYSCAKTFGMNPVFGMGIAMGMLYPNIQGVDLNVFGFTVNATYTSTVLPIIFVVYFASFIYKAADKYCPKILSSFLVPVIVFGISIPVGFVVIGPVFNTIAQVISDGIMALYDKVPIVAAIILGMAWQVLVIFGMHSVFSILAVMQMASGTGTPILAMIFPAFFAQAMTVWAIFFRTKSPRLKSVCMSAGISGLLGVTEPAIYSVTLPRLKYFIYSCIGTAGGALVMALTGTLRYSLGGLGFLCIPTFFGEGVTMSDVIFPIAVSLLVAGGISFALTFLTYKDDQMDLE